MRFGGIIAAALFAALPVHADFNTDSRGTATAQFLKLGAGARAMALGEAYSALADDASALYWNPAAMARLPEGGGSATVMHAPYVESSYYDYAALAQRFGSGSAIGIGAQYFNAGSLTQIDRTGNELGSFTPYDLAGAIGFAQGGRAGAIGVTGKFIQSKILATAQTFAADVGYLTPGLANDRVRLAFVAQNLGGQMKFENVSENLPLALRFGSAFALSQDWSLSADLAFPRDNGPDLGVGTEYRWRLSGDAQFAGRLGYNSRTSGDLGGFTGLAIGAGFGFRTLSLDYAFLPMGDLGLTHRISLTLHWGQTPEQKQTAAMQSEKRSKEVKARERRCEDIFGSINCQDNNRPPLDRVGNGNPAESPRPW